MTTKRGAKPEFEAAIADAPVPVPPAAAERPRRGGSYVRQADGTLQRKD